MKVTIIGFILSFMAIFPLADFGGGQSLKNWMEEYERFLIRQNAENFRREKEEREQKAKTETVDGRNGTAGETAPERRAEGEASSPVQNTQPPAVAEQAPGTMENSAAGSAPEMVAEVNNEQTASEEIQTESPGTGSDHVDAPDQSNDGGNERVAESVAADPGPGLPETGTPVAAETTAAAEVPAPVEQVPIYAVNGAVLAEDLQAYLYRRFCAAGIGWFYEYALLIAYQESRFNIYAVNQKNMMDSGLFQFRSIYWSEYCGMAGLPCGDIFDPYLQIDVFTFCMARRLNQFGCSIPDAISRHKQSDYGQYDQEYVNQVMQHMGGLCRVR